MAQNIFSDRTDLDDEEQAKRDDDEEKLEKEQAKVAKVEEINLFSRSGVIEYMTPENNRSLAELEERLAELEIEQAAQQASIVSANKAIATAREVENLSLEVEMLQLENKALQERGDADKAAAIQAAQEEVHDLYKGRMLNVIKPMVEQRNGHIKELSRQLGEAARMLVNS